MLSLQNNTFAQINVCLAHRYGLFAGVIFFIRLQLKSAALSDFLCQYYYIFHCSYSLSDAQSRMIDLRGLHTEHHFYAGTLCLTDGRIRTTGCTVTKKIILIRSDPVAKGSKQIASNGTLERPLTKRHSP